MRNLRSGLLHLLSVFLLVACGAEQIGVSSQTHVSPLEPRQVYEQLSCSSFTLIKPKVDILYVVDNSGSTYYVSNEIRTAIKNTVDSISAEFDYRVIGTSLLPDSTDANPFDDYQLMTNSQDPLSSEAASRKVISSAELNFFSSPVSGPEKGLGRVLEFVERNRTQVSPSLFRQNAYLLVVLVSNGRDVDVETMLFQNGETTQNTGNFNARKASFMALKDNLASEQLRLFSVTADHTCTRDGWLSSNKSYIQMSRELYQASGATDNNGTQDWHNLCGSGLSQVFTAVNNSIRQILLPHVYRYWPITFARDDEEFSQVSINDIRVMKVNSNAAPVELPSSNWTYHENITGNPLNIRVEPTVGEPVSGRHFIKFNLNSYIRYPECVIVKSLSKIEYFGYIVLPREPKVETLVVKINGQQIPQSSTNGWSYVGTRMNQNVKMPHPGAGDELPAVLKTGFMVKLNGSANYYKAGDNVEATYIPAGLN